MAGEQSGSPVTVSDLLLLRDDLSEIKVALADLDAKIATLDTVYRGLDAEINGSFKAVCRHVATVTVLIERNASSTPREIWKDFTGRRRPPGRITTTRAGARDDEGFNTRGLPKCLTADTDMLLTAKANLWYDGMAGLAL